MSESIPMLENKPEAERCAEWLEHLAAGGDVVDLQQLAQTSAAELRRAIELARETVSVVAALAAALGDVPHQPVDTLVPRMIERARALAEPARPQQIRVTEEMHVAACKVLIRAHGLDGLPQRMLDAMLSAAPQPVLSLTFDDARRLRAFLDSAAGEDLELGGVAATDLYNALFAATPEPEAQEPSPTAGMTIAQRILHVGGRNNAAGYIEFGSIQAVEALVRQVIRDLPGFAQVAAQPEQAAEPVHWRAVLAADQVPHQLRQSMHVVGIREKQAAEAFVEEQATFYGWRYTLEPLYTTPQPEQRQPSADVIQDVIAERERQDSKWGGPRNDDQWSALDWHEMIADYNAWARRMQTMRSPEKARRRYIQIAALAVAAAQAIDRAHGTTKGAAA